MHDLSAAGSKRLRGRRDRFLGRHICFCIFLSKNIFFGIIVSGVSLLAMALGVGCVVCNGFGGVCVFMGMISGVV